jgi:hypothetical protein
VKIQEAEASRDEQFQSIIVELKTLKAEERRLQRAYGKLRRSPTSLTRFWSDLVALRNRADRLDAVLDPTPERRGAFKIADAAMGQLCA